MLSVLPSLPKVIFLIFSIVFASPLIFIGFVLSLLLKVMLSKSERFFAKRTTSFAFFPFSLSAMDSTPILLSVKFVTLLPSFTAATPPTIFTWLFNLTPVTVPLSPINLSPSFMVANSLFWLPSLTIIRVSPALPSRPTLLSPVVMAIAFLPSLPLIPMEPSLPFKVTLLPS